MSKGISKLVALIYLYLDKGISGRQLVKHIDKLVAEDQLLDLPDECKKPFDDLHENLALCVWDEKTYREGSGVYTNEADILKSVKDFISKCKKSLSEKLINIPD